MYGEVQRNDERLQFVYVIRLQIHQSQITELLMVGCYLKVMSGFFEKVGRYTPLGAINLFRKIKCKNISLMKQYKKARGRFEVNYEKARIQ